MTRLYQRQAEAKRSDPLKSRRADDAFERDADRAADAVMRGELVGPSTLRASSGALQRAPASGARPVAAAPAAVSSTLRTSGQPLEASVRTSMEDRFGFDFSRVRVHADAEAAASAAAVRARAYTVGSQVVFGAGEYAPRSPSGQRLLAHELTHVRQQQAAAPVLQRWSIFDEIAGWFAGDTFDPKVLSSYLGDLGTNHKIEDHSDSDNKARAIVAAWKKNRAAFTLTPELKALLIKEMQSGFTGDDDERAILDLLTTAADGELTQMFTTYGLTGKSLDSDFHGSESDELDAFIADRFVGGYAALKRGEVNVKSGSLRGAGAAGGANASGTPGKPDAPRQDFVFIMGEDRVKTKFGFYVQAAHFFEVHYPQATLVTDQRTLTGLLSYIETTVKDPIGNLFIVAHGNEDGTLAFGFDDSDLTPDPDKPDGLHGDAHLSPMEVRDALHPSGGGASTLATVEGKIDAHTTIHVRGCDLGQNAEFLNLFDEAFGGKGRVVASTHEQDYGTDTTLGKAARDKAVKAIEASEPMPPKVDSAIKDKTARKKAEAERKTALAERQARVAQKLSDQAGAIDEQEARAASFESMSGVVMQRPGTTRFTKGEITTEINRRYGHLSEKQRAGLITAALAKQRIDTQVHTIFNQPAPLKAAQAPAAFASLLRAQGVRPDPARAATLKVDAPGGGAEVRTYTFFKADGAPVEIPVEVPGDAQMLRESKEDTPNPQNYEWSVTRVQSGPNLKVSGVGKRVFLDLHHQSLNVSEHEHFAPGEDNPLFYRWSTFEPDKKPVGGKP